MQEKQQTGAHWRSLLILAALATGSAQATNGYFSHGYGITAKGMGGAATATAMDGFGGANNPASMAFVGNRFDLGADWFMPTRDARRSGAAIPSLNGLSSSEKEHFLVPEFAYVRQIDSQWAAGVSVFGNGGLNTTYPQGNYNCGNPAASNNMLCGAGELGVDMMQLIVAPTVAWQPAPGHALGLSLLLGYQRFAANGLQAFANAPGFPPFTSVPSAVTNNGHDSSSGVGLRLGYQGQLSSTVRVGISYAPRMKMSKFERYRGLFAEGGSFDIPSNLSLGLAVQATPALSLALDWQRIAYGDVPSIANPSMPKAPLGAANGPGFGWQSIKVWKLGASYQLDPVWTLRAGLNKGDNPVRAQDVTFNILAPGTITDHATFGLSYAACKDCSVHLSLMVAKRQNVSGPSLFNGLFPAPPNAGGSETVGMRQQALGLAFSKTW